MKLKTWARIKADPPRKSTRTGERVDEQMYYGVGPEIALGYAVKVIRPA